MFKILIEHNSTEDRRLQSLLSVIIFSSLLREAGTQGAHPNAGYDVEQTFM